MKKSLFYSLMTTATLLSPVFAVPSWAKDCPEIPKDITEITVKIDSATLRTEADKSSGKGFKIAADDKLKVLDHKSTVDKTGQELCWYQVSAVKDTTNKPYFIADVGIKEFPFANSSTGSKNDDVQKQLSELSQDISQQKWLVFVIIGISIGNIIILWLVGVWVFKVLKHLNISGIYRPSINPYKEGTAPIDMQIKASVEEALQNLDVKIKNFVVQELEKQEITRTPIRLTRIQQDLGLPKQDGIPSTHQKLTKQEALLQGVVEQLTHFLEMLHRIENANQSNQDDIKSVTRRVESLEENQQKTSGLGHQETAFTHHSDSNDITQGENESPKTESHAPETSSLSSQESSDSSESDQNSGNVTSPTIAVSPQLQEIIDRFNQQNPKLFDDFSSQPLTLTQQTIQGKVAPGGGRILQLEVPAELSQGTYLKFEMDNASWLIPNITSIHYRTVIKNLGENSDIFTICQGSGSSLKLVMPAKLKASTDNSGLWEIAETGIFEQ